MNRYYRPDEYNEMVRIHQVCNYNAAAAARMYAQLHPEARHPCAETIEGATRRSRERHFDTNPARRFDNGRPASPRMLGVEDDILQCIHLNPTFSLRDVCKQELD